MNWTPLTNANQLAQIDELSKSNKVLIFKHSTRCSISSSAKARLERNWKEEDGDNLICYYLDLIQYRELSNLIALQYKIEHESPQALIIGNGKCIFSQTHSSIYLNNLLEVAI